MARHPALVIGEALIDIVERVDAAELREEHVGGSPANVAIGLARLGHSVCLAAHVGTDARGRRIERCLTAEGVDCTEGSFRADRTSTALASIDAAGAAHYDFDITWRVEDTLARHIGASPPPLAHVGSIALFLEPGGSDVASIVASLPTATVVTADPNIRPELLGDHAAVLRRFEEVATRADLVKLSNEDAAWLYPSLSAEAAAEHVLGLRAVPSAETRRPRFVVMTYGAAGARAIAVSNTAAEVLRITVPAAPTTVVDTISAGDSFMAALISSLLGLGIDRAFEQFERVLRRAIRAAAIAVSAAGANPPYRAELDLTL